MAGRRAWRERNHPAAWLHHFLALPESLGLETRYYRVRRENGFRIDPDEIKRLVDSKTKLILVNSPHNPTGATIRDAEMEALHDFTAKRGIQLVSDEVYHPIYHGRQTKSAARLPHATVIADLSKAFSIAGVRTGWMIEHDAKRRQQYGTARAYFSICNITTGEILSEIAIRRRDVVLGKTQEAATRNLKLLECFMADHRDLLGWIPPQGGMTAFSWLVNGESDRRVLPGRHRAWDPASPGDCVDPNVCRFYIFSHVLNISYYDMNEYQWSAFAMMNDVIEPF